MLIILCSMAQHFFIYKKIFMETEIHKIASLKGGEWLIKESEASDVFTPEDFDEEQKMVMTMCEQFLNTEVLPAVDRIDNMEKGLMPSLIEKDGNQGLLSVSLPE